MMVADRHHTIAAKPNWLGSRASGGGKPASATIPGNRSAIGEKLAAEIPDARLVRRRKRVALDSTGSATRRTNGWRQ